MVCDGEGMRKVFFLHLIGTGLLLAQTDKAVWLTGGVKLGAPLNDPAARTSVFTSYTQGRWTGGPTVELRLPYRFAVEFDALYRGYRTNTAYSIRLDSNLAPYQFSGTQATRAWDLPLLLKYRFKLGVLRPFVSAGYQWTHESREFTGFYQCTEAQGACKPSYLTSELGFSNGHSSEVIHGPAAGAGLEFRTRYVTIAPEFRFSRPTHGYPRENRATALVGFTFGGGH